MKIDFSKYQGTGNDFVMIDNRSLTFPKDDVDLINKMCDRKFGIGADGLILLESSETYDFQMVYFNADGKEGSMCGNGGRCIVAFARALGIIDQKTTFDAIDGRHEASIQDGIVRLKMIDIKEINTFEKHIFMDTGSPHHVEFHPSISDIDVNGQGAKIRYGSPYFDEGSNVNFAEQLGTDSFKVRTYERGVENETLACGTGVTAVAIAAHKSGKTVNNRIAIEVPGGQLEVCFTAKNGIYEDVYLIGPAKKVFKGLIDV